MDATFGNLIRAKREALGLTQRQAAEAAGIAQSGLSLLEQAKQAPSAIQLNGLLDVLYGDDLPSREKARGAALSLSTKRRTVAGGADRERMIEQINYLLRETPTGELVKHYETICKILS